MGVALAAAIALAAWRSGSLSRGGALAATVVGALCVSAGWRWGTLLIAFFVTSSALSRIGERTKASRTAAIVEKGGARDATQVLANGGLYALAALGSLLAPWGGWDALGVGALAAAAADTWGTEVGTLATGAPRVITTWRRVPAGTSGAVSGAGLAASAAGAVLVAGSARLLGWSAGVALAGAAGGAAGALADSLAGALVQARRRCPRCATSTERRIHPCGTPTERAGGLAWLDNDRVNLVCGAVGAAVALVLWS